MSPYRLPLTIRVSLIVTLLMIAVSTFASQRVLSRLADTQARQVQALADVYLDGLSVSLVDSMIREDIWQVFDVLDRSRQGAGEIRPVETIVVGIDGFVIASSNPIDTPSQTRVPAVYQSESGRKTFREGAATAYVGRDVFYEKQRVGGIFASFDVAPLVTERREVLWTLILTNAALTLLLAGAAWAIVWRMMRPVRLLTDYLERSHGGNVEPIPEPAITKAGRDYQRPFAAFNKLARALAERETLGAQLAEEERLASLGRLASGMAHEINNPLGGLFNALDTLRQHGEKEHVRRGAVDLIERGLKSIRDVVRATLLTYRVEPDGRFLRGEDIGDLELLILPEVRRRDISLQWHNALPAELPLPATPIRQIILNLVLNACQAAPRETCVTVTISASWDELLFVVEDQGAGLPPEAAAMLIRGEAMSPPIGRGGGLGLWMTGRLIRELTGTVIVVAKAETGTHITVSVPLHREGSISHAA